MYSDIEEIKEAFYNDGYNLAENIFNTGLNVSNFVKLSESLYEYIDGFIEILSDERNDIQIACKKGCDYCCNQPVWILPFEAHFLMNYLNRSVSREERELILMAMSEKDKVIKGMKAKDFLYYKHPCPLLIDKKCVAYEARPMACRIYLSLNLDSCIHEYNDSRNVKRFPELLNISLKAGQMLNEGVSGYLSSRNIYLYEWLLESHLNLIIKEPEIFEKWTLGKNCFKPPWLSSEELEFLSAFTSRPGLCN